jgi:AcrR family transcriptional regulator
MALPKETKNTDPRREISPRERILAAARKLFYALGIRAVSVDEIAAEAGTNKMTLYRHFESKDRLVAEYLRSLSQEADAVWGELARTYPGDPLAQLRAWIEGLCKVLTHASERGCALANAAVEIPDKDHPARPIIEEHKTHQRAQLARLCNEAHFLDPEKTADEIFLLLEGARINVQSVGRCGPCARLTDMLSSILKSHPRRRG